MQLDGTLAVRSLILLFVAVLTAVAVFVVPILLRELIGPLLGG